MKDKRSPKTKAIAKAQDQAAIILITAYAGLTLTVTILALFF
ncbi:MAG: hypothetical protein ACN6I0_00340 [Peredibacter sp.]|jgi:hypothetical protein|nr:hypothetical protein [Bdellovibrionota bacterium]